MSLFPASRHFASAARRLSLAPVALLLTAAAPEPKKPVDLQHYTGRWFEVARLHNKIEDECVRAEADYIPRADGGFTVTQTCVRASAKPKFYHADMKVLDPGMNAKFRLTFFPFVWKDYWVLDFAPDNSWLVLGEPTGRYLWLFSRKPAPFTDRAALVNDARTLGYDTSKLIYDKAG